jgi:hypothetical protein
MISASLFASSSPLMLAQSELTSFREAFAQLDILTQPDRLLDQLAKMPLFAAAVVVAVGALCIINGYKWHKWVVIVLAFMLGLAIGHILSQQMGKSLIVAGSLGVLFACIATPMLRWTVAVFGGLTGAFLGANAWTLANANPPDAQWAGACMGFIALALLSFVVFRLVVVMFTSIGGGAMVILGGITLLMQVPSWAPAIRQGLTTNQYLIPMLVTVAAVAGFVIQESRVRAAGGGAASGGGGGGGEKKG